MKQYILKNRYTPKHEILSPEEKEKILKELGVKEEEMPKILSTDPVVKAIGAKKGDLIRITREDDLSGYRRKYYYYRIVK